MDADIVPICAIALALYAFAAAGAFVAIGGSF